MKLINNGATLRLGGKDGTQIVSTTIPNNIQINSGTLFSYAGEQHFTGRVTVGHGGATLVTRSRGHDILFDTDITGIGAVTALGHEAKEPLRTIPRAVLQCALGAGVFFILSAYAQVLGFRRAGLLFDKTDAPMHVLADQVGLPLLGLIIDAGAVVSMFACMLACVNGN